MIQHGVAVDRTYNYTLPELAAYRQFAKGTYPKADQAAREVLNLPCYPHLQEQEVLKIAASVQTCVTLTA